MVLERAYYRLETRDSGLEARAFKDGRMCIVPHVSPLGIVALYRYEANLFPVGYCLAAIR